MSKKFDVESYVEIPINKLHLPMVVDIKCGSCGNINYIDLENNPILHPVINGVMCEFHICDTCGSAIESKIKIGLNIEIIE